MEKARVPTIDPARDEEKLRLRLPRSEEASEVD
jgi:hypothetical protein